MENSQKPKRNGGKTRVLLVEDHAVVRFGMAQLINRQADMTVCAECEGAAEALSAVEIHRPDLVLCDLTLKEGSGMGLLRNIKARFPRLPVVILSVHDEVLYAEAAFRAGARGYLMKHEELDNIVVAIRRVLGGGIHVSGVLAERMVQQQLQGGPGPQESPLKALSDRELEVFQLLGSWKSTRDIARELHLSVKTVEYYREQIKRKLNLRDAAELVQCATSWARQEIPA